MKLRHVEIKNFRLLSDVHLALEELTTVVVGRNNSGKTSLSEVIRRLLADGSSVFQLEDFSSACYDGFLQAWEARSSGRDDDAVRTLIPFIELRLTFQYDPNQPQLGPLSPFVIDLDPDCTEALVVVRYELKDGQLPQLFDGLPATPLSAETRLTFFRTLRDRIPSNFATRIWAEDPNDAANQRQLLPNTVKGLVKTGFINAQRGLDDVTSRESDVLAKTVELLFATASSASAAAADKQIADALTEAVQDIQSQIDTNFGGQLKGLIPALKSFGYPGLGNQELHTETLLDVRKLLSNFTKVRYAGYSGVALPESYNGLGARNLIFILLQLAGFYKAFRAETTAPGVHLIFIEEPEAHLHPQMQEVFIRQLAKTAQLLVDSTEDKTPWPVQFVVSTHSSHVANEAGFESIRYFLGRDVPGAQPGVRQTTIKDLRRGLDGVPEADKKFLHQYMTLTRCDLFFADKAILVEGLSERLLLPVIIGKLEGAEPESPRLSSQYVTTIEVGGAYAHLFFKLLRFLELRSLIITDLDAVEKAGGSACEVHKGTYSSNACLKAWFSDDEPFTLAGLLAKGEVDKIREGNRIAYQCSEAEGGPCGRTFEDAFILANQPLFGLTGDAKEALEIAARSKAGEFKKSEFALKYAIEEKGWSAPKYLVDGVRWLAAGIEPDLPDPALALAADVIVAGAEANPHG
ncbi:ATP-dependent nuclease [Burkholderia pseudomallei]|uniref:ATP-dependent nuclease n=1 Tax=Burkholderia pseudomallei TaxID=28450 RepID=UPI000F081D08|nr:ATP-dependent endonuclease [Burkholderia pseudomallei]MBF3650909.1 AAA family ATPase [Burkholderia pseudomallei]MBF3668911.1 AAA family ATPase [Burkholderia pseudomallei]MBF3873412.1 AAA family ATPase [Burkholderia pseudomallei]MBF3907683.1 AAA family ATPase [Burkholderia pseudomallei]